MSCLMVRSCCCSLIVDLRYEISWRLKVSLPALDFLSLLILPNEYLAFMLKCLQVFIDERRAQLHLVKSCLKKLGVARTDKRV